MTAVCFRKCEICKVQQKPGSGVFLARFPSDTYFCRLWVKAVGETDLLHIPVKQLHNKKYVCGNHFIAQAFGKNRKKLRKTAVPTTALLKTPLEDELLKSFPPKIKILQTQRFIELAPKYATRKDDIENSSTNPDPNINENNGNEDQIENYETTVDTDLFTMDQDIILDDFDDAIEIGLENDKIKCDEDVEFIDEQRLEKDPEILNHSDFKCNACRGEIIGFRYVCLECSDWDMCTSCEARGEHPEHYVLRLPAPRPYAECEPVIAAIRQQIEKLLILSKEIKSEIYFKEETNIDETQEIEDDSTLAEDPLHTEHISATNEREEIEEDFTSAEDREEIEDDITSVEDSVHTEHISATNEREEIEDDFTSAEDSVHTEHISATNEREEIEDDFTSAKDSLHTEHFSATNDRRVPEPDLCQKQKATRENITKKVAVQDRLTTVPLLSECSSLTPEARVVIERLALQGHLRTPCIVDFRPSSKRKKL